MNETFAWVWASGLIETGTEVPDGVMTFCTGEDCAVRELVGVVARHGYNGELLMPGVPEATDEDDAIEALIRFVQHLKQTYSSSGLNFEITA